MISGPASVYRGFSERGVISQYIFGTEDLEKQAQFGCWRPAGRNVTVALQLEEVFLLFSEPWQQVTQTPLALKLPPSLTAGSSSCLTISRDGSRAEPNAAPLLFWNCSSSAGDGGGLVCFQGGRV